MSCECVHSKNETTGTSVLEIRMDDVCTKTLKMICEDVEEWIYMYIHGTSEAECEKRCLLYREKCIEENKLFNKCRQEIVLGYKPQETFKPVSTYTENPDGTSTFTMTLDALSTECFPNLETRMKYLLCHRADIEVKRILKELMTSGHIDETKTKREMVLAYEREVEVPATPLGATQTDINRRLDELETTQAELTETKSALETTRADLEEKTYQLVSVEARLQALEQKILAAN